MPKPSIQRYIMIIVLHHNLMKVSPCFAVPSLYYNLMREEKGMHNNNGILFQKKFRFIST